MDRVCETVTLIVSNQTLVLTFLELTWNRHPETELPTASPESGVADHIIAAVVGCRAEVDHTQRTVLSSVAQAFAASVNAPWLEVSACAGEGVRDSFFTAIEHALNLYVFIVYHRRNCSHG